MKKFLFLFGLTLISMATIAQNNSLPDGSLQNTRWKLTALTGLDTLPTLRKEAWIQFTLQENRFRGYTGLNNMSGTYNLKKGATVTLGPIATTRMAGPEPMMKVENRLLQALSSFDTYKITGDTLTLFKEGVILARFEALYLK